MSILYKPLEDVFYSDFITGQGVIIRQNQYENTEENTDKTSMSVK